MLVALGTLLIAVFEAVLSPFVIFSTIAIFSDILSEKFERTNPKSKYPSLDVAIAEIAFEVREGRLPVGDINQHLVGFSKGEVNAALTILYETKYLTVLDVDFEVIEEQMLFCHSLASSISISNFCLNNLD